MHFPLITFKFYIQLNYIGKSPDQSILTQIYKMSKSNKDQLNSS